MPAWRERLHIHCFLSTKAKNGLLCFIMLCISLPTLYAQESFVSRPAQKLTTVPFNTLTGGVVVVKVRLEGYPDTLNFILDTGSGGISIDSTTCLKLKIPSEASDKLVLGIGGVRNVRFVNHQSLYLGSLKVDSLNLHVSDYSILSSVYGDKVDGIMGYSFLSRYIVKIDYDSSMMTVYSKGAMRYPRGGFLLRPALVSLPVQAARLREDVTTLSKFYFDTGAGLCLLLTTDYLNDTALFSKTKRMFPTQAQGMGGKANMELTTLKEFRLGPYRFRNMPTHVFTDQYNITSYPYLAGLIGNDILRRFNLLLNYEKKSFYLTPNSHFLDPFDYSYTGLGLYWDDSGDIMVGDIMKDSPAELAGFKVGDLIISVNENVSRNLQSYKIMMQNVGQKLKVIALRNGTPVELSLKVKSIL